MANPNSVILKPATPDQVPLVVNMIRDISRWLTTKGISQWSESFPSGVLVDEVSRGELFVLCEDGEVIASVALGHEPDHLWDQGNESALYLHRLVIARKRAGERLGEAIMAWAEDHAIRRDVRSLRLVCDANNPFLPSYYEKFGYKTKGTRRHDLWNMTFARFEKHF